MRRKDREVADRRSIDQIIERCRVCHLALSDDGQPYVIPLNFGYDGRTLYFHSASAGRKLDIITKNNRVGFAFDILHEITEAEMPCNRGTRYESVVGSGTAEIVESPDDKVAALGWILRHYGSSSGVLAEGRLDSVTVFRVSVDSVTGKARK